MLEKLQNQTYNRERAENSSNQQISLSRSIPPTLLRIHADNQDKRNLCIFWALFFIILIAMAIASTGLPDQLIFLKNSQQLNGTQIEKCENVDMPASGVLACQQQPIKNYGMLLSDMSPRNQFGVVYLKIYLKDMQRETEITRTLMVKMLEVQKQIKDNQKYFYKRVNQEHSVNINMTFHSQEATKIYADDQKTLVGYSYPLWYVRQFQWKSYVVIMEFDKPLIAVDNIMKAEVRAFVVNSKFTLYTIVIRYFFFVLSLIGIVLYITRFRIIPKDYKIVEQKMVLTLSIFLIFFNDPIYPATVLTDSRASSYFSVFFMITFTIYLLFYWIFFLDRILYEDGLKQTALLNAKRIGYILVTYIMTMVLYTSLAFDNLEEMPIVPAADLLSTKFVGLQIVVFILVMAGFIYIFVNYARICSQVDSKLWRNQLFMFFSIFFIFISIVMFFVNGYHIFSYEGNRILLLYTQANLYTFYMQYMYSITKEEKQRIIRGQLSQNNQQFYENDQHLLNPVGDKDCVDLEFDELPSSMLNISKLKKSGRFEHSWRSQIKSNRFQMRPQQRKSSSDDEPEILYEKPKIIQAQKSFKEEQRSQQKQLVKSNKPQSIDFFNQQEQQQQQKQDKQKKQQNGDKDFGEFQLQ